ncbi:MAG: iron-containing alcohol dehydrogenase [Candidatus Bathyarchaeota archaeon]|jgi:hydroxyacid-oxoacid transhydrogenase|nr:iron-containing alcohol dehydrogenase [Candidatus Bathyarchaeota archaeon]
MTNEKFETAFTMDTSSIKFGPGVTREVGYDMKKLGASRVLVVTDPNLTESEPVSITLQSLQEEDIEITLFDQTRVEPTDHSFKKVAKFASEGNFDGFIGVGGGSSMDTAKIANLYSTYPADFLAYVNAPIGQGLPVPGPLKPMIAIPTTAGTGSETTGVAIFDLEKMRTKTGIAHRTLRPIMGIIDPNNTRTVPKIATASCGFDVLCHALESITAIPFNSRPAPESLELRPAYQGANPISHLWASKAIEMVSKNIVRVVQDPSDDHARAEMILAATFAGIGFGNAGVHLAHGMSYPISGMVREYKPEGIISEHPIIPHGMCVVLVSPAVFRFTAKIDPELHLYAAQLMGVDTSNIEKSEAGDILANEIIKLMRATGMPNGIKAVGYGPSDIEELVQGTLPQHRVTKLSPRPASSEDLRKLFTESMELW